MRLHETDVTSLVFGLVFLGSAVVWLLVDAGVLTLSLLPVVVPVLLVVVGVVGVAASITRDRRESRTEGL